MFCTRSVQSGRGPTRVSAAPSASTFQSTRAHGGLTGGRAPAPAAPPRVGTNSPPVQEQMSSSGRLKMATILAACGLSVAAGAALKPNIVMHLADGMSRRPVPARTVLTIPFVLCPRFRLGKRRMAQAGGLPGGPDATHGHTCEGRHRVGPRILLQILQPVPSPVKMYCLSLSLCVCVCVCV